ncbi:alpha/beta hydrolase [Silvimonas sp. JCM 19000]
MPTRELELLHSPPTVTPRASAPLLFVHGAYAGAWCWKDNFLPWFAAQGYDCYALSLTGHGASAGRDALDKWSINDFQADLAWAVQQLPRPPVLLGHSLGGFLAQRHAQHYEVESMVLLASVAPWGLFGSLGFMAVASPHLLLGLNRFQWRLGRMDADLHTVRELLFSAALPQAALQGFADRAQPESALALAELMVPQPWLAWGKAQPPACLVLGAAADRIIPVTDVWATARTWQTEPVFLPDIAHAMMLDYRWESVAQTIHDWLARGS